MLYELFAVTLLIITIELTWRSRRWRR